MDDKEKEMVEKEVEEAKTQWILSLALFCFFALIFGHCNGCTRQMVDEDTLPHIVPVRVFSPRCEEVSEELPSMRHWCSSTEISARRAREACRFVEEYERNCQ